MAIPSVKHTHIEDFLTKTFGKSRQDTIRGNKCMTCGADVNYPAEFRDERSVKEYSISGMCMKCQDSIFGFESD